MNEIQYVVFDMDGTIIDNEWAHEEAKISIIRSLGGDYDHDMFQYFIGRSNRLFWEAALEKVGRKGTKEEIDSLVARQFAHVLMAVQRDHQSESKGLTQMLRYCRETGRKTALCSGSDEYFVHQILDHLGVRDLFDIIINAKYSPRLKPYPDIYLYALREGGFDGKNAIAFEDSKSGIMAVHGAGMRCIGFTNEGKNPQNLSEADYRADALSDGIAIIEDIEKEAKKP